MKHFLIMFSEELAHSGRVGSKYKRERQFAVKKWYHQEAQNEIEQNRLKNKVWVKMLENNF